MSDESKDESKDSDDKPASGSAEPASEHASGAPTSRGPAPGPLHGVLAEYESAPALLRGAAKVRDAGFRDWDTFSPFPVHGIDGAMGIRPTILPWIVLAGGLTGCATALLLQWWTNAWDYPFIISGKPFWSIPANIPITFELTVLFSAFCAFGGMLALNKLPHPAHALDFSERFRRSTTDRFYVLVQASDPLFDERETSDLLQSSGAVAVEPVPEDTKTRADVPRGVLYVLLILASAATIPFSLAAYARESKSEAARIHIIPDMDWQPKYKAQRANSFFEDNRSMRPEVEGTIAVGELRADDHFHRGKANGAWARTFPPQIEPNEQTMEWGRERFGIYCTPCHGETGESGVNEGMVSKRATALAEGTWVPPANLSDERLRYMPVGELFNTMTNGIRNMPAYGRQIPPEDRWAIIMYMRALQRSRAATRDQVPDEVFASLK